MDKKSMKKKMIIAVTVALLRRTANIYQKNMNNIG